MHARIAVLALGLFVACDVPTAPTPGPAETGDRIVVKARDTVTLTDTDPAVVHPLFEDHFWRELAFNQHDQPGTVDGRRTRPFPSTSPNVYVWLANEHGERVVLPEWRDAIYREVPRVMEEMTGEPYRGRLEDGMEDRSRRGWITFRFTVPDRQWCGTASVGADPGSVHIAIDAPFRLRERGNCHHVLNHLIAHELGHAMGLWHVSDPAAVMAVGQPHTSFIGRERYHAQLLFRVGGGAPYCGWPLGSGCSAAAGSTATRSARFIFD